MGGYRFLEHISDLYIEAYGKNLNEAFKYAGIAMFAAMTNLNEVRPNKEFSIEVRGYDLKQLLYNWLEELLYLHEVHNILFSKIEVSEIKKVNEEYILKAKAWGEEYDPTRHESKLAIKAPTYSLMEIVEEKNNIKLRFVLDI